MFTDRRQGPEIGSGARPRVHSPAYRSFAYAKSLHSLGEPIELVACGGWILKRRIPQSALYDAMGCYPLFACRDWTRLGSDLDGLGDTLVSLVVVTDPFGNYTNSLLTQTFDVVSPFKQHYVTEAVQASELPCTRHHRRNLARARRCVEVGICDNPESHLDEWRTLYSGLVRRHRITGVPAFSGKALGLQLQVPGLVMFRATVGGAIAGIHIWYVDGEVAYGHLGATNTLGYETMASYALYAAALEALSARIRWMDLGAAPGVRQQSGSGLDDFKSGWATTTRSVHICGKIFNADQYQRLMAGDNARDSYFPGYRIGEFGHASGEPFSFAGM
jgi:hypothetical protein